jgi:hypothetical protein
MVNRMARMNRGFGVAPNARSEQHLFNTTPFLPIHVHPVHSATFPIGQFTEQVRSTYKVPVFDSGLYFELFSSLFCLVIRYLLFLFSWEKVGKKKRMWCKQKLWEGTTTPTGISNEQLFPYA